MMMMMIIIFFLTPRTQFTGNEKIMLCNAKKYKNHAGMNLTPPPSSQNSHVIIVIIIITVSRR